MGLSKFPFKHQARFESLSSTAVESIALPFGNKNYSPNFSTPTLHPAHSKRVDFAQTFEQARCRGATLWERIQRVYQALAQPGRTFTHEEFEQAWIKNYKDPDLDDPWLPWFDRTAGEAVGHDEVNRTEMFQNNDYTAQGGRQMVRCPIGLSSRRLHDVACSRNP